MKKNILPISLAFVLAGTLCGCSDDSGKGGNKPSAGSVVNFTLSPDKKTHTAWNENDNYQIDWVDGDKVRIFCDEAEDVKRADYEVIAPIDESNKHKSTLKYNPEGLAWGNEEEHNFYAVYPADDNRVSVQNGIATFQINSNQICTVDGVADADGHYTTTPDMTDAYMVANLSTVPVEEVSLKFRPIMTTLNITVRGRETNNTETVLLTGISIVKKNSPVKGEFKYDMAANKIVEAEDGDDTETVFVRIKNGTDYSLELQAGQSVTFTVFLPPLPVDSENQIDVRVHATGEVTHEVTIGGGSDKNGNAIEYAASSKGSLTLGWYPTTQNGNNWITPLDDDIYVSQLSIPGTHDAATQNAGYLIPAGRCQDYTIEEQLAMGIRAFDLRPTTTGNRFSDETSDGNRNLPIYHGMTSCKTDMETVFSTFNTFLAKNPGEFIIVTCRWENEGAYGYPLNTNFSMDMFNKCMTNFLNNATNYPSARKVVFKPDLTIGEMRGKILIIMRPNQGTSPDGFYATQALSGTTFISGWPAGSADVRTGVYFKSQYEGAATGYAVVQDNYNPESTTIKISLVKEELEMSARSHTNSAYTNTWFINHCSGYIGSAASYRSYSNNAAVTNPAIYEYLTGTDKTVGSTGIMLLDFVGKRTANVSKVTVYGDLLPQAIIDNNYKYRMKRKGE